MQLTVPIELQVREYENQATLKICCSRAAVQEWCTGLERLREGSISSLKVLQRVSDPRMAYSIQRGKGGGGLASVNRSPLKTVIEMKDAQLGYVYSFLRTYQEQGSASVDHVDIEATNEAGQEAYITFSVPKADAPMTPEAAAKWFRV